MGTCGTILDDSLTICKQQVKCVVMLHHMHRKHAHVLSLPVLLTRCWLIAAAPSEHQPLVPSTCI